MPTVITEDLRIDIPDWVTNLSAFRRWVDEPEFPEKGNIWWLRGKVWADMSKEQIYSHNLVRTEITSVLHFLVKESDAGLLLSDGLLLSNAETGFSGKPDATFVSYEAFEEGRAIRIEGKSDGFVEIEGSADMVLEVVSDSSEDKDLDLLREDYFLAGVREYWIVDARPKQPTFVIFRRNAKAFVKVSKLGGWLKSAVFGHSFRLVRTTDRRGDPKFVLEVKS